MQSINHFVSGYGKHYTNNPEKRGKACFHESLPLIDLNDIEAMLANPQCVDKDKAQWVIFSNLQSRVHKEQRERGLYGALWCDIDDTKLTIDQIKQVLEQITNGCLFFVYTSRSNTPEKPKYRGIVPLATSLTGHEYERYQSIFNDKLERLEITPDRATERAAQPCYLPNRGEHYDYRLSRETGEILSPEHWQDEYQTKRKHEADQVQQLKQRQQKALERKQALAAQGESVIDAVNRSYSVDLCLNSYGYKKISNRWLSPLSQSGSPAVVIKDNKWISHHESDIAAGIGERSSDNTCCFGDAFDLVVFYEYNNDRTAALKAVGDTLTTTSGQTINKVNQQAYRQQQDTSEVMAMFKEMFNNKPSAANEPQYQPKFDLTQFSLKGESKQMEAKMLEDKFVLGKLALLGQATAFYAQPNAGKTLMTLWLLIEAIKADDINANDVFYINADDNHKGLVTKLKLAETYSFHMLSPSYKGFNANDFLPMLRTLIHEQSARGKILILDTLKKFTDVMDKKIGTEFGKVVREFVSNGGTVIMLAHVNKHRDNDGKLIFSGTSDIVDDADCAYTLDTLEPDMTGRRVVTFENFKSRGDVAAKVSYSYLKKEGLSYTEILESVEQADQAKAATAELQRQIEAQLQKNELIIEVASELIKQGINAKTELADQVRKNTGESLKNVHKALKAHEGTDYFKGHRWRVSKVDKNKHIYILLSPWGSESTEDQNAYKEAKAR